MSRKTIDGAVDRLDHGARSLRTGGRDEVKDLVEIGNSRDVTTEAGQRFEQAERPASTVSTPRGLIRWPHVHRSRICLVSRQDNYQIRLHSRFPGGAALRLRIRWETLSLTAARSSGSYAANSP